MYELCYPDVGCFFTHYGGMSRLQFTANVLPPLMEENGWNIFAGELFLAQG